jgi:hypothetical protein
VPQLVLAFGVAEKELDASTEPTRQSERFLDDVWIATRAVENDENRFELWHDGGAPSGSEVRV